MDSFVFYKSWLEIIRNNIDDRQKQNELIRALVEYGIDGTKTEAFPEVIMFLQQAYAQVDSAQNKHQKRVEAGRKGGKNGKGTSRNSGNQNAKKKNNSKTIANENVNDNVNDNLHSTSSASSLNARCLDSNDEWKKGDFDD